MTKRKDKKGGALKGRALAAKDAVKSKATAVPGAEPTFDGWAFHAVTVVVKYLRARCRI